MVGRGWFFVDVAVVLVVVGTQHGTAVGASSAHVAVVRAASVAKAGRRVEGGNVAAAGEACYTTLPGGRAVRAETSSTWPGPGTLHPRRTRQAHPAGA